ncbi:MAG: ABC transporter substrate-binding protein [Planctomycetes bacterium]|jgi:oligopeptide transport system substrate-binding protein|nr:ABC transporter substrate-binding protein [Planctomycetota bacterium]MDP6423730.1 peptide ABC transporter substrate-binding protein [Planctomycetota bacterium]
MRRDRIRNAFAFSLGAILLIGAGIATTGASIEPADLTFHNATEPESLDPAKVTGVPEGRVLRALFSGLTVQAPDSSESLPDIAESWNISPNGKVYTFRIRKTARWSDGSPCTADDFVYSWRRLFAPETAAKYAYLMWAVDGAEDYTKGKLKDAAKIGVAAPDPYTFVVKLREPQSYFIYLTAFYPSYAVHRATLEAHPKHWHKPEFFVGNGPFTLQMRLIRERMRFVKNEYYWDAANVKLETVDALPIEDNGTALNLYLTGAIDWTTDVPAHVVPQLLQRDDFKPTPRLGIYFYRINQNNKDPIKKAFFGEPRVRRALYLALDRKAICERVTRAGDVPARHIVPPGLDGYESPKLPDYDPVEAARLMQAALSHLKMSKAPTFSILYNTQDTHKLIAEVVQSGWRKHLGLDVKLENMEWQSYLKTESSFEYDISRAGWIGDYPDPNTFLDLWQTGNGNNRTGWSDPDFDRLIVLASKEVDVRKRLGLLAKAEARALAGQVVIPIYFYVTKNCVRPWIKGWHANVQDRHNLKFLSIDKDLRRRMIGR